MDVAQVIAEGFDAVKSYIDRGFDSFVARLEAVEDKSNVVATSGRDGLDGKDGAPGKDASPPSREDILAAIKSDGSIIADVVTAYLKANLPPPGRDGADGKDGSPGKDAPPPTREDILAAIKADGSLISAAVADYLKANPPAAGCNGADGKDGLSGKDGRDGIDGKDAQPVTDARLLELLALSDSPLKVAIAEYFKAFPVAHGRDGSDGKDGLSGKDGRDGIGLAGAVIDREGQLTLTLSDGSATKLGFIVGKDGAPGKDAADGRDGFGFDDLQFSHDGERGLTVSFVKGEARKDFTFIVPAVIDRGVWREGSFKAGDGVSRDGSWFVATRDTDKMPGTPDSGWRLAAKRGRDGASAFDVAVRGGFKGTETQWLAALKGERGPEGRAGRDLTQLGFDGQKR